jgi:hypothetical protein
VGKIKSGNPKPTPVKDRKTNPVGGDPVSLARRTEGISLADIKSTSVPAMDKTQNPQTSRAIGSREIAGTLGWR